MKKKLILTDADGVLLDWEWAFSIWMQTKGYRLEDDAKQTYSIHHQFKNLTKPESKRLIRTFNESAAIGFLPPLRDAVHYVKRLNEEHGYVFHVITSLSKDEDAGHLREMNLQKLFGNAIYKVTCLDTGADKDEALAPYKDSGLFWIEDKPENADTGYRMGLSSLLVEHGHNMKHNAPYPVVKNWKEIYEIITKEN